MILAEIISVGSELLGGSHPESNSLFLAEKLAEKGIKVRWKTVVGDVYADIAFSLKQAIGRAKVVILTGGLGSTVDDCTREVVATVTAPAAPAISPADRVLLWIPRMSVALPR